MIKKALLSFEMTDVTAHQFLIENEVSGRIRDSSRDEFTDRRLNSLWWLLPSAALGLIAWFYIIRAILAWLL